MFLFLWFFNVIPCLYLEELEHVRGILEPGKWVRMMKLLHKLEKEEMKIAGPLLP